MVLYQTPDEKIVFDVVSRFDAAMRLSKRQPVIQQNSRKAIFVVFVKEIHCSFHPILKTIRKTIPARRKHLG